jgi:hypothetical protein
MKLEGSPTNFSIVQNSKIYVSLVSAKLFVQAPQFPEIFPINSLFQETFSHNSPHFFREREGADVFWKLFANQPKIGGECALGEN